MNCNDCGGDWTCGGCRCGFFTSRIDTPEGKKREEHEREFWTGKKPAKPVTKEKKNAKRP